MHALNSLWVQLLLTYNRTVLLGNNLKTFRELTEPNQENSSVENSLRCANALQYSTDLLSRILYRASHLTKEKQNAFDSING